MSQPHTSGSSGSIFLIEAGVTVILFTVAASWPQIADRFLHPVERAGAKLAARKRLTVILAGCTMLLLRLAMLPWLPAPNPVSTDDFSFLLAADTFAHGRLTNPTPTMWTHLETIHVTMQPTYMSMYFPGQGLVMAAGQLVFGHPWAGILLCAALMCAALCWMLQGWLPPRWALLGTLLAIVRIGLFSYWVNSYTGAATLTVTGGALVLGAMPRLIRTGRFRYGMLLSIGISILALTRPYEGVLICLPVACALAVWLARSHRRPPVPVLLRRALAPLLLVAVSLAWLGHYDKQAFGKATILPYTIDRAQYAVVPYYIWQPANPTPHYRHANMRRFYTDTEAEGFHQLQALRGFVARNLMKVLSALFFFAGFPLLLPVLTLFNVSKDRRIRFFLYASPFWIAGMAIGVFLIPHYLAPFTAAVYVLGLQSLRHLRQWKPAGRPVGFALVRACVLVCLLMGGLRAFAEPLSLTLPEWPIGPWLCSWVGPGHYGQQRAQVAEQLKRTPGKHLVLVRYADRHEPADEWVYNGADIDGAQTVWAQDMSPSENAELARYFSDRDVWLVQPDDSGHKLMPYPAAQPWLARLSATR